MPWRIKNNASAAWTLISALLCQALWAEDKHHGGEGASHVLSIRDRNKTLFPDLSNTPVFPPIRQMSGNFDWPGEWVPCRNAVFRPSAAVSRDGVMESCTCRRPCHQLWGTPPSPTNPEPGDRFCKSCSFQVILRENPIFWANFGLSPAPVKTLLGPPGQNPGSAIGIRWYDVITW